MEGEREGGREGGREVNDTNYYKDVEYLRSNMSYIPPCS